MHSLPPDPKRPGIVMLERDFIVVWKPAGIHTAPLRGGEGEPTLLEIIGRDFPEIREIRGRQEHEGGLVHRLDGETEGLVLIARHPGALASFLEIQERGLFIKEYCALSRGTAERLPGFPPVPAPGLPDGAAFVESAFRPWGPGRKQVRPVMPEAARRKGNPRRYRTEMLEQTERDGYRRFLLRLRGGFRHQIRCHLAWLGFPVLGDRLYGGETLPSTRGIALRAAALSFPDGAGGVAGCRVPPIPWPGGGAGEPFKR